MRLVSAPSGRTAQGTTGDSGIHNGAFVERLQRPTSRGE
jgi:hypothetical protein